MAKTQPRGATAAAAVIVPEEPKLEDSEKKLVTEVLQHVSDLANTIRQAHGRINATVMEIGKHFFSIKQILDAVPTEVRRVHGVPSFTAWMNKTAPTQCGMSDRTVWHYYQNYSEAIAAGLKPETIIALAPDVFKNEKPRKAILTALQKNPGLALQLNEAANKPAQLQKIAASPEIQDILKSVDAPTRSRAERLEAMIVSSYKSVFLVPKEEFSAEEANEAIRELNTVLQSASKKLGISSHLSITFSPWTEGEGSEHPPIEEAEKAEELEEAIPKTVSELVHRLAQAGYKLPTARPAGR